MKSDTVRFYERSGLLPDLSSLTAVGIPLISAAEFQEALEAEQGRRKSLKAYVENGGWAPSVCECLRASRSRATYDKRNLCNQENSGSLSDSRETTGVGARALSTSISPLTFERSPRCKLQS